ncbi:MAG: IS110 family transposase [Leptospira sp.]|jgi:transposase|nr:IS110 family transposase [Leptospira sp.]
MIIKYSLGLDVSSKDIKACLVSLDIELRIRTVSSKTISNSKKGFIELQTWIKKWYSEVNVSISVCMEATGVYHENCAYFLHGKGYDVSIVLPNKAKKYLQSLGLKSKNDSIDAQGLARMGAEQKLDIWEPMGTFFLELRVLTRQYQSIQETKIANQARLHSSESSATQVAFEIKQIKSLINFLDKQIAQIELQIAQLIRSNEVIKAKFDKILKLFGISLISGATVIAETGGFNLFKNYKQLVSYAGYDVVENQSGNHVGRTKISKKGNSRLRRILHMPSLVAIRQKDSVFGQLYLRIYDRSGIKMKGIVAVQKKLLIMIYYIWTKDIEYNPSVKNIQEEKQVPSSQFKKNEQKKPYKSMASQGRRPVSYHSKPPLSSVNVD